MLKTTTENELTQEQYEKFHRAEERLLDDIHRLNTAIDIDTIDKCTQDARKQIDIMRATIFASLQN